jgi:hypothetical protein
MPTAIRIPGKRYKRRVIATDSNNQSSTPSFSRSEKPSSVKSSTAAPSSSKKRRKRQLSPLEQLPAEILQPIFLSSVNINLPLSSPELARRLSSPHIYEQFTLRAFCPPPHQGRSPDWPKDLSFLYRTRIVQCRFFTWDFLVKILERARKIWESAQSPKRVEEVQRIAAIGAKRNPPDLISAFLLAFPDWSWGEPYPVINRKYRDADGYEHNKMETILDFAHFHAPEKLLHGPWKAEKVRMLDFLSLMQRHSNSQRYYANTNFPQLVKAAIRETAKEKQVAPLKILLDRCIYRCPDDLFKSAVLSYGCDPGVVELFLQKKFWPYILDRDNAEEVTPEVAAWAITESSHGNENAKWLQEQIELYDMACFWRQGTTYSTFKGILDQEYPQADWSKWRQSVQDVEMWDGLS